MHAFFMTQKPGFTSHSLSLAVLMRTIHKGGWLSTGPSFYTSLFGVIRQGSPVACAHARTHTHTHTPSLCYFYRKHVERHSMTCSHSPCPTHMGILNVLNLLNAPGLKWQPISWQTSLNLGGPPDSSAHCLSHCPPQSPHHTPLGSFLVQIRESLDLECK